MIKSKYTKDSGNNLLESLGRTIRVVELGRTVDDKSLFKCLNCDNNWITTFSSIVKTKNYTDCPKCSRKRASIKNKISDEEILKRLLNKNISIKTRGKKINTPDTHFKCLSCNHTWITALGGVISIPERGCPKCSNIKAAFKRCIPKNEWDSRLVGRPIKIKYYGKSVLDVSTTYVCLNNNCGNEWSARFSDVGGKNNTGCPKCAIKYTTQKLKLSLDECNKRISGRSVKIVKLGSGVSDCASRFVCLVTSCQYSWTARFVDINRGGGCPKCAGKVKLTEDECNKKLENKQFKIIKYAGVSSSNQSVFKWNSCDHTWEGRFSNAVKLKNSAICKICEEASFRGELKNREIQLINYSRLHGEKCTFKCNVCQNNWKAKFVDIKLGGGCPACVKTGFNTSKPAWVYRLLIDAPQGACYGFGITNFVNARVKEHKRNIKKSGSVLEREYEPLYFDSGRDAQELETRWKQSPYVVDIGVDGFKTECVLVNKETTNMIFI